MLKVFKASVPGLVATMIGIGFSRFSFTPLSALMVEQGLLSSQDITVVAAGIMAGYALGAFGAHSLSRRFSHVVIIRAALFAVAAGLFAEALSGAFWPVLVARFVMSIAGALLMVLGPALILSEILPPRRGFAAGIIFTGIGIGIVLAGSIVAALSTLPQIYSSLCMVVIAALAIFAGWGGWPSPRKDGDSAKSGLWSIGFAGLFIAYLLDAIAFIPHTVYLSDYVSSELGHGAGVGGYFWAIFGVGGIVGALSAAGLRKAFGPQFSLELVIAVKAVFIALAGLLADKFSLAASAFVVGALVPGIVMLVSTRLVDLVGQQNTTHGWAVMTGGFAIGQFLGATGMAFGYRVLEHYQPLFVIGGGLEAAGLIVLIISLRLFRLQQKGHIT